LTDKLPYKVFGTHTRYLVYIEYSYLVSVLAKNVCIVPSLPDTDPDDSDTDPDAADTDPVDPDTDPVDPDTDPVDPDTDPVDPDTDPDASNTDPDTSDGTIIRIRYTSIRGINSFCAIRTRHRYQIF
jgi:hypothetical protein